MTAPVRALALLLFVSIAAVAPSRAEAGAVAPMRDTRFRIATSGAGVVDDTHVEITCTELECRVRGTARVRATTLLTLTPSDYRHEVTAEDAPRPDHATLDGEPLVQPTPIEPGQTRTLVVELALDLRSRSSSDFLLFPILQARHIVLGDTTHVPDLAGIASFDLLPCEGLTFEGTLAVDASERGAITVALGEEMISGDASLPAQCPSFFLEGPLPPNEPPVIQNGGPTLSLGGRLNLSHDSGGRFALGLAYEIGLVEHLIASVSIETDFESLMESLVIEIGSPAALIIIPSLAIGVGVVARQLGNRDADAALRLRATVSFPVVGLGMDFDYWPAVGEWTSTISGRISL